MNLNCARALELLSQSKPALVARFCVMELALFRSTARTDRRGRKQWSRREEHIERVTEATVVQGFAGKSWQEIDGLALPTITIETGKQANPIEGRLE